MCKTMLSLGSVIVELTDITEVTTGTFEAIKIVIEKKAGYNPIITVIYRNTIIISIIRDIGIALKTINVSHEQCIADI